MLKHPLETEELKTMAQGKGGGVNAPFYCLNLVDEYNLGMGNVDQADQLRLQ